MIGLIQNSPRLILCAVVIILMTVGAGCKSKKKAMEAADASAEKAKMEQEAALRKQKEEELKKNEAEEKARREEEKKRELYTKLEHYFNAVASANSVESANGSITEALTLFVSGDTPVLIVISNSDGNKDYDRPTTIRQYLNYLKDQKKNPDKIGSLQFDSLGRISEVELVKQ